MEPDTDARPPARGRRRRRHRAWPSPMRRPRTRRRAATSPAASSTSPARTLSHAWRRQAGIARRAAGEMALWGADPVRIKDVGEEAVRLAARPWPARSAAAARCQGGSPLWVNRSRRRHLETLQLSLDDVRAAGKLLGGTVNDVFVAGAVERRAALPRPARLPGRGAEPVLRGQHPHRRRRRRQRLHARPRAGPGNADARRGALRARPRPHGPSAARA